MRFRLCLLSILVTVTGTAVAPVAAGPASAAPAAVAAGGGVRPTAALVAAPVDMGRVMIVGDSISQGSSGDWTWRYRLWKHLAATGVTADFVGPGNALENIMTTEQGDSDRTYADPAFDQDHNAQWGRPYADELRVIEGKVAQHTPDYLLVLLGVNDLAWSATTPAELEERLRTFIANARRGKADLRIVLGKILPTRRAGEEPAFRDRVAGFNQRLVAAAAALGTARSPIVVADTETGFVPAEHTWDGTHANARGELRIAAAFADALAGNFAVGSAYPRPFPSVAVGPLQAPRATVTGTGPDTADLAWTPSLGATQYWIWTKDTVLNRDWVKLPIPLTQAYNPWHMTQLSAGVTYHYKIQAAKGDDPGAFSNEVSLTVTGRTPGTPTNLTVTAGDGEATLRWTAAEHASGYLVSVRDVAAGADFRQLPFAVPAPQWTAELLENGATYQFKIQAVNGAIKGGTTPAVAATPSGPTPAAPTGLRATAGDGEVTLEWTAAAHATGYSVAVRDVTAGEGDFTTLPFPVSGEKWVAGQLVNGATYEFRLTSKNGRIAGGSTAAVRGRPTAAPPAAPTGLTAAAGDGQATLRWTAAAGATGYLVHVKGPGDADFKRLPYAVAGTTWVAEELVNGAAYQYRLQAVNGLIEGGASGAVTVRPTVEPPPAPTALAARAGDHEAALTWRPAPRATGYYVWVRNLTAGDSTFSKLPFPVSGDDWVAENLVNGGRYEFKLQSVSGLVEGGTSAAVSVSPTGGTPGAPTNFAVRAGDRKAVLSWQLPDHASSVYIEVKNPGADWTRLPYPVADDHFTSTGLVNGARYEYRLRAYNDLIGGGTTAAVAVTPTGPGAPGPETATATSGNQRVTLNWTGTSRATGYYVWVTGPGQDWTKLPYPVSDDTFTHRGLINGAGYSFKIQSVDGMQPGGFSNTVSAVPRGPTPQVSNLRVSGRLGEAQLRWTGSATATGNYIRLRDVTANGDNASFTELPFPVSGTSFTAGQLTPGHVYDLQVQAVSGRQRGVTSNTVRVTLPRPPAVARVTVRPAVYALNLSWKAVPGADGYAIYYRGAACGEPPTGSRAGMTRLPLPVTGTSFKLGYLFNPGCWWVEVVAMKYGVEAAHSSSALGYDHTYRTNEDSHLYEGVVDYIYKEMRVNSRAGVTGNMRALNATGNGAAIIAANLLWMDLVRPNGVWDHKPAIKLYFGPGGSDENHSRYRYHVTRTPSEILFDVWSNIHYGYVGRQAGFDGGWLQWAAAQVGIHDEGDAIAIQIGIDLYQRHGLGLTRGQLDAEVHRRLGDFAAAQGQKVTPFLLRADIPNVPGY